MYSTKIGGGVRYLIGLLISLFAMSIMILPISHIAYAAEPEPDPDQEIVFEVRANSVAIKLDPANQQYETYVGRGHDNGITPKDSKAVHSVTYKIPYKDLDKFVEPRFAATYSEDPNINPAGEKELCWKFGSAQPQGYPDSIKLGGLAQAIKDLVKMGHGDKASLIFKLDGYIPIEFDANGGTFTKGKSSASMTVHRGNTTVNINAAIAKSNLEPKKDGFVFKGWQLKDHEDLGVLEKDKPWFSNTDTTKDRIAWVAHKHNLGSGIVLVAQWEPDKKTKATITYDLNGGTLDGKTGTITEAHNIGDKITISKAPTKDGYTFSYWEGSKYNPGDEYTVVGDHTFKAVWNVKEGYTPSGRDVSSEYTGFYSDKSKSQKSDTKVESKSQKSDTKVENTSVYEKKYSKALPKTSDTTSVAPLVLVGAVSALALSGALFVRRRFAN